MTVWNSKFVQNLRSCGPRRTSLLGILILSAISLSISSAEARSTTAMMDDLDSSLIFRMNHISAKDTYNQRNMTRAALGLDIQYALLESTSLRFTPLMRFKSGYQQTQQATNSQQGQLSLQESTLNYQASFNQHHSVLFSGGILNISEDSTSLLLQEQSFPGIRSAFSSDNLSASLSFAIPTSQSLSTQTQEFEPTPSFVQLSLGANFNSQKILTQSKLGYYKFENLPQSVATASGPLGNTVQNVSDREYRFNDGFGGPFVTTKGEVFLNKNHCILWDGSYLQNMSVESEMGRGWSFEAAYKFRWPTRSFVSAFYQHFSIAPDAAVAQYNEEFVGGTNRNGFHTGLRISLREKLILKISGGTRDAIFESPTIQRENFYRLGLESNHVDI